MGRNRFMYLYSGAIGEALLGLHIGRVLSENYKDSVIEIVSMRDNYFVRELVDQVPFARYRVLHKHSLKSWLSLLGLMCTPYYSVVLQPVTVSLPLWWQIVLWSVRRFSGHPQVACQMQGHEYPVPKGVKRMIYVCQTENYFSLPPRIISLWGLSACAVPEPSFPKLAGIENRPYIVFHFFAGNYRRSVPVAHAREILIGARAQYPNLHFILTCQESEFDSAQQIASVVSDCEVRADVHAKDMLGLLSHAVAVVGTTSGILILAAHLHVPVVAMSVQSDLCWLPTWSSSVVILAALAECRCRGNKMGDCVVDTPYGAVYRCLYYITADEVMEVLNAQISHVYERT